MGKIQEILARARAKKSELLANKSDNQSLQVDKLTPQAITPQTVNSVLTSIPEIPSIVWNEQQQEFIQTVLAGQSCILFGKPGAGKSTVIKGALATLLENADIPALKNHPDTTHHRYLPDGIPGIIICSYTNRSVNNINNILRDLKLSANCHTIHKILEYSPEVYQVIDEATGETKNTMRFIPTRDKNRPLPDGIKYVIMDESANIPLDLAEQLYDALPNREHTVFIYVGDLNQLPPVFGASAMIDAAIQQNIKRIELTQVYRQARDNPIIDLTLRIVEGEQLEPQKIKELYNDTNTDRINFRFWQKRCGQDEALFTLKAKIFAAAYKSSDYVPGRDIILCPFNKGLGTIELNKHIAQFLAKEHDREVWEVIAGFNKYYYSIGDVVIYNKDDYIIKDIKINSAYSGKWPQKHSKTLDYWGAEHSGITDYSEQEIEMMLDAPLSDDDEIMPRLSSHIVTLRPINPDMCESESEMLVHLSSSQEVNNMTLGYALTVHKAQGSQWENVFLILHHSHSTMLSRELLYTACSRPKQRLFVICENNSFKTGIATQRIKGANITEKIENYKQRQELLSRLGNKVVDSD